jgi:3-hydroxybutyryl-CoA dehydrogenase
MVETSGGYLPGGLTRARRGDSAAVRFRRVGVVGAGVIGAGVAQLFAQTGHDVVLVDVRDEPLERARRGIARNLKLAALLHQEHPEAAAVLARLETARDVAALAGADFVIENVPEDWELKRRVHGEIHAVVSPDAPIAANTSAIPITRIASAGPASHRVVGMHFMNPPR